MVVALPEWFVIGVPAATIKKRVAVKAQLDYRQRTHPDNQRGPAPSCERSSPHPDNEPLGANLAAVGEKTADAISDANKPMYEIKRSQSHESVGSVSVGRR
jgi:hypothetical protein